MARAKDEAGHLLLGFQSGFDDTGISAKGYCVREASDKVFGFYKDGDFDVLRRRGNGDFVS